MWKFFIIIFLLFTYSTLYSISLATTLSYQLYLFISDHLKTHFTQYQIKTNLHKKIAKTIIEEVNMLDIKDIDPLLVLAVMEQESSYRNVMGDHNRAVGFFQIHKPTADYVAMFYPDIKYKLSKIGNFNNLLKYPILQTKIAVRYLGLTYKYRANKDLLVTLTLYNGRNPNKKYNAYVAGVMAKYSKLLNMFIAYLYKNQN